MKNLIKTIFILSLIFSTAVFSLIGYFDYSLGENYFIVEGSKLQIANSKLLKCENLENFVEVGKNGTSTVNGSKANVTLFGVIPIKTVNITATKSTDVVVLGNPFGIKIFTEGVLVVGFSDVQTKNGTQNPAKSAGIKLGDTIIKVNDKKVLTNSDVQNIVSMSSGKDLELQINRDGKIIILNLTPKLSKTDNQYKIGMWIRDSSAGIGTLTFYCPSLNITAGLGHGICDIDTGELVPFRYGKFVNAEIIGVKKATKKETGELQGVFSGGEIADIVENDITGIYANNCNIEGERIMPIALKQEVEVGNAEILATIDGQAERLYSCKIEKVYHNDSSKIKNIIIKITDKNLINKTGGIVQGMSGSPILQNGKLIGAVTHVLVDDPTKGYAIFAENMLETAQSVAKQQLKEVS